MTLWAQTTDGKILEACKSIETVLTWLFFTAWFAIIEWNWPIIHGWISWLFPIAQSIVK